MKKENEENQKKIWEYKSSKVLLILIALFIIILLLIDPVLNRTVKDKIQNNIKNSERGRAAKIDDVSYSLFGNDLTFNDVYILLGNNSKFSEKRIGLQSEKIRLEGVNWFSYLFGNKLSLDNLIIDKPVIVIYDSSSVLSARDTADNKHSNSLFTGEEIFESLPDNLRPLNMDLLKINNGILSRQTIRDTIIANDSLYNINLIIDGIRIDKEPEDKKLIIADNFDLKIDSIHNRYTTAGNDLRLKDIKISSQNSSLSIKEISYKPFLSDEEYFSRKRYSSERFIIDLADLEITSFEFGSLLKNKYIDIDSISGANLYFDVLTDKTLPSNPNAPPPEMPSAALQSTGYKVHINNISLNGDVHKKAKHPYFEDYAEIFFTGVKCNIKDLTNFGGSVCTLDASGNLQNAAPLEVHLTTDLTVPEMNLKYYGSLASMDAKKLNKHLIVEEKLEVTSGYIEKITFNASVDSGIVSVSIKPIYEDLSVKIIDKKDKEGKTIPTFLANNVKLKKQNPGDNKEPVTGHIIYKPKPHDAFLDVLWQALLKGLGDVVGF